MDYNDMKSYDNPPAIVAADSMPVSDTLGKEMDDAHFDDKKPKDVVNKKRQEKMSAKQVLMASRLKRDARSDSAHFLFEIIMYSIYLVVLVYIAFVNTSSQKFFFAKSVSNAFLYSTSDSSLTFDGIKDMDAIWEYFNKILIKGLYWDSTTYNISTEEGMVMYENKLLGRPVIRMLKVHNKSCVVPESFSREIKQCFSNYKEKHADKLSFGTENMNFEWKSSEELETSSIKGVLGTYDGSGFVVPLPKDDADEAYQIISELKSMRFIDRGTRALIVDFALFNGNVNIFIIVRLLFELPATGGVMTTSNFYTFSLFRYTGTGGYILVGLEGAFMGFTLFLLVEELFEIVRSGLRYFTKLWNLFDVAIISLSIACFIISYKRTNIVADRINSILKSNMTQATMDDVVSAENTYHHIVSIILFLSFIKVFKYISVNQTMSQLSDTLSRSSKDIGGFFVMFSVFFFAYAQFGYLVFGTQIEDYSTFVGAIFALLRIILGDFDYLALERANRYLGPAFFLTYVFFVFFVLLNMFLAIINDSYVQVKTELEKKKTKRSLFDWIKSKFNRMVSSKARNERPSSPDLGITFDDYKNELLKLGYKEKDITDAFIKLDISSADLINERTMDGVANEMQTLLERRREIDDNYRNHIIVNRRIDALQEVLSTSVSRFELIMTRIADIEHKKVLEKEKENKLLIQNYLAKK
ncbi:unnamed protein product [Auanema sp. JU1783]|nr:unnamed protein product [Auanema sp. JU1783]